ncbi:LVIVD repeat-containing protein [Mesorhizobium sp. 10J20-29]
MANKKMHQALNWNFKLLSHHTLDGFGGMGEGMSVQIAKDGRRILWLAHESAPKNFTGLDVTNPLKPRVVVQTDLPQPHMRSNSLEVVGNLMAVAYQTRQPGQQPAGMELFDVSIPEDPRSISFFDCSGPHSRGVHQLWFVDGQYVHMAAGAPDFEPHNQLDDQFYRIIDVRDPAKPVETGRWWLPGTRVGDTQPPPIRHEKAWDSGFRAHNTNVYTQRPDRCYLGYLDAGMIILDISNMAKPKMVSRWDNSPPYYGFTHTALPLFDRELLVVTDESVMEGAADWPKLVWILDARDENNPVPISTCPKPPLDVFGKRGGRFGAHNLHENVPLPTSWCSEQIIVGTFFNGGLRAYDISDAYQPREVGYFVPPPPDSSPVGEIQLNDVFIDERGIVYTVDRHAGGVYILEMEF